MLLLASVVAEAAPRAIGSFAEVRAAYRPSEAWLLDRHGEVIQSFRVDPTVRRLDWVPLADLSPALKEALIAAEDRRFLEHGGVDWQAFIGAAWSNLARGLKGQRQRGASTLTMQLAGLLDPALEGSRDGRRLDQKWAQVQAALDIESRWSKEQILEAYFNLARFRGELTGIDAAARGLYGKTPSGVSRPEAAILVALLRGPAASARTVATRACTVAAVASPGETDCPGIERLAYEVLGGRYRLAAETELAPHLRRLAGAAGSRTITTLDAHLQRTAVQLLHQQLAELAERNVEDGAIVVIDNASGDVLAYVGSSGDLSRAREVDGASARRQAGSTLKPFLYGLALEQRLLTAASILDDSPLALTTEAGLYVPQNYDKDFKGPVTVRMALASSLNVPAVRTLMLVGLAPFRDRLQDVGLETIDRPGDYYGYGLALGSAEVTLLQLTNAYRTIANGGRWGALRFQSDDPPSRGRQAMEAGAAFIVAEILSDRGARAFTFGLDNPLATRSWSAVKTGTSKDMRDNWCIGFSTRYTVGVWVGNASGEPMRDVSGIAGAAPIWREMMQVLQRDRSNDRPLVPASVERVPLRSDEYGAVSSQYEWFLRGTVGGTTNHLASSPDGAFLRISYPNPGTVIAVDPDIPASRQRVAFRSSSSPLGLHWTLDGEAVENGRWEPVTGHHYLVLWSADQKQLDQVDFEVRGVAGEEDRLRAP